MVFPSCRAHTKALINKIFQILLHNILSIVHRNRYRLEVAFAVTKNTFTKMSQNIIFDNNNTKNTLKTSQNIIFDINSRFLDVNIVSIFEDFCSLIEYLVGGIQKYKNTNTQIQKCDCCTLRIGWRGARKKAENIIGGRQKHVFFWEFLLEQ